MATVNKGYGRYRSWSPVRDEDNATNTTLIEPATRLQDPDVKKKSCISFTPFFIIVLVISVIFLLGIALGYYVRESQIFDNPALEGDYNMCLISRKNSKAKDKLDSIHEDVMYFLTGERISKFVKSYGSEDPQLNSVLEKQLQNTVSKEFESYVDAVHIENYPLSVTYPHKTKPNKIKLFNNAKNIKTFVLKNEDSVNDDNLQAGLTFPYVAFTHGGFAKGRLIYGHYGRLSDLLFLQYNGFQLNNTILLLKVGQIPIRDKISLSVKYGVKGILLYWDDDKDPSAPANPSVIPFLSAGPYTTTDYSPLPSIPVQSISKDQADWIFESMTGSDCPDKWLKTTSKCKLNYKSTDNITLDIRTYNIPKETEVTNIIGTINGQDERDRYVLIGAPRSSFSTSNNDVISSTAVLLQLVRSLSYVQDLQKWKPKRTIKFLSWGGSEFTDSGLNFYIQSHKELLMRRAIAYFDINQLAIGDDTLLSTMSPALQQLLTIATMKVPDPKDPEKTIHDMLITDEEDQSIGRKVPINNYNLEISRNSFLHQVGIPSVHLQYVGQNQTIDRKPTMLDKEKHHHYKYHAAVGRVMVLVVLRLVDQDLINYSLKDFCNDLHLNLWTASEHLSECSKSKLDLNDAILKVDDILDTTKTLQEYISKYLTVDNIYKIRSINDQKLLIDNLFLLDYNGTTSNMLYPVDSEGIISWVSETCRQGQLTKNWSPAKFLIQQLETRLTELDRSLRSSG